MIWCIKTYIIVYVKTDKKMIYIIHYVKPTAQLLFNIRFPKARVGNSVPVWNVSFWLLWRVRFDQCDGIVGIVLKYTWPQRYRHNNHNDTFHTGTCSGVKCIVVISVTVSLKLSLNELGLTDTVALITANLSQ